MESEEASREIEILAGSSRLGKKIVVLDEVTKKYDNRLVIGDFSYIFARNDRVGVVGPNGAGKSTLLNLIAGNIQPDHGRVEVGPTVKFGFFTQECTAMNEELRVIDYIKEQAEFLPTADGGTISATQMLERFLFPSNVQYSPIAKLSGGERRRLFLLRVLMGAPNVLLLDEPTNDLDIQTLSILEDYLEDFSGVVIAASHDRYFLDRVAEKIIAFEEDGKIHCTAGNYSYYREERERLQETRNKGEELKKNNKPKTGEVNQDEKRAKPNRLSYMEQREYDGIETVIAEVEEKLSEVKKAISRSGSDYQRLQELTQNQDEFEKRLEQLLERWTYLSELVESYQKK
jgi:ATP-binding cassette subfamily F protein uup